MHIWIHALSHTRAHMYTRIHTHAHTHICVQVMKFEDFKELGSEAAVKVGSYLPHTSPFSYLHHQPSNATSN